MHKNFGFKGLEIEFVFLGFLVLFSVSSSPLFLCSGFFFCDFVLVFGLIRIGMYVCSVLVFKLCSWFSLFFLRVHLLPLIFVCIILCCGYVFIKDNRKKIEFELIGVGG